MSVKSILMTLALVGKWVSYTLANIIKMQYSICRKYFVNDLYLFYFYSLLTCVLEIFSSSIFVTNLHIICLEHLIILL